MTTTATTLLEGSQFALTSHLNKNQSMIFVKLTDSALKTIEDYASLIAKGNISPANKPSIQFHPNSKGVLTVPGHNNDTQAYNFSIKDIQNDGILECINQKDDKAMESLGKVRLRMQIHANDDVYQTTKHKMALAAEESKKNNTVILDDDHSNVNRKLKRPFQAKFSGSTSANMSAIHNNKPSGSNAPGLSRFKLSSNGNSLAKNSFGLFNSNALSESNKKSIREHLIHLLAVRPYKISELLSRVQEKEPADKNTIVNILNDIAIFKDSAYHLNESSWDEVQLEWPQYTKDDRDSVMRRHPQIQTTSAVAVGQPNSAIKYDPPSNSSHGNSISPKSDVSSANSPNSLDNSPKLKSSPFRKNLNMKRSREGPNANNFKKLKSDNYRNNPTKTMAAGGSLSRTSPSGNKMNGIASNGLTNGSSNCHSDHDSIPFKSNMYDKESFNKVVNSYQRISGNGSGSINSSPNSSPDSGISHIFHNSNSDSSLNFDNEDFISKYTRIQNDEQLLQYKKDFDKEYPNYKKLYDYVENICRQFTELKESILCKEEESEEWNELIKQTIEKYDEIKNRSTYTSSSKKLCQLHNKLTHIKNLIRDYLNNKC